MQRALCSKRSLLYKGLLAQSGHFRKGRTISNRVSEADTDAFVDHITRFSLAGIRGIRADLLIETRKAMRHDQE